MAAQAKRSEQSVPASDGRALVFASGMAPGGKRMQVRATSRNGRRSGRKWRQRSCTRSRHSRRQMLTVIRPRRIARWSPPTCQALPQMPRCRRSALLSLASGYEVGEWDWLQSSPLVAVTAPWPGPHSAHPVLRVFTGTNGLWRPAPRYSAEDADLSGHKVTFGGPAWAAYLHQIAGRFRAVFFSPRFDPLPPCPFVQAILAEVVRQCARLGLQCWIQTRGVILPVLRQALVECQPSVRVTLALSTLDDELARALEPGSAPPRLRLRQLQWLLRQDIPTQVTLAPLLPDLTDTATHLLPLLAALKEMNITRATFGYLVLDPLANWHDPAVVPEDWAQPIAELYEAGQLRRWSLDSWARCLSWRERQRRYARLIAWAAELGMDLRPSTLADPDFRPHAPADSAIQPAFWSSGHPSGPA